VRSVAYNVILIAGVSTLLFNGNPLLRYDGYYILSDLIEIPNLRQRSGAYLAYLFERWLVGREDAVSPAVTPGERPWFVAYGIASSVYRLVVVAGILLLVASRYFFVGVTLGLWCFGAWIVLPLARAIASVAAGRRFARRRARAVGALGALLAAVVLLTCVLPLPLRTRAEGVVWIPEQAIVRAGADGFVERVLASNGARVQAGEALLECRDPELEMRLAVLEARRRELQAVWLERRARDLVEADLVRAEIAAVEEELAEARRQAAELTLRAAVDGVFVAPHAEDLPGNFLPRGAAVARVIDPAELTIRVVVGQSAVEQVQRRTRGIRVILAEQPDRDFPAGLRRVVPAASEELPSTALGSLGGGGQAIDPTDPRGLIALERLFQLELGLEEPVATAHVGGRVHVRFEHGSEPLAGRLYRGVRRLFLSRFGV
jgi:putative peptide zinc metalloprotease protein